MNKEQLYFLTLLDSHCLPLDCMDANMRLCVNNTQIAAASEDAVLTILSDITNSTNSQLLPNPTHEVSAVLSQLFR